MGKGGEEERGDDGGSSSFALGRKKKSRRLCCHTEHAHAETHLLWHLPNDRVFSDVR